ncbi:MAG: PA2778 family cysteine peptidase [Pseudomonadota bacterium]
MSDAYLQLYAVRALKGIVRAAALFGLLTACAGPDPFTAPRPETARKAAVTGVPLIQQADFFCGPASLAMVMQWSGIDVTQQELAGQAFTPGAGGTYLADMLGTARRRGQLAVPVDGFAALTGEVDAGNPVIVFQNLGLSFAPIWHYGVVTAYDLDAGTVTLNSGQRDVMVMAVPDFLISWDLAERWAITLTRPDRLPSVARELDVLQATAALESAGQADAAVMAYQAGTERWRENWLWPFGLGNALYATGNLPGAEAAFRAALRRNPASEAARNNLAEVRRQRGAP